METVDKILQAIIVVLGVMSSYIVVYRVLGFILPSKKFPATKNLYNYAVLICARNEENVIAQLVESVKKQNYPQERITVFVVAHNCTDNTAQTARDAGAVVYEFNNDKKRKGYAVQYALEQIRQTYKNGIMAFDGYFLFDADNLLPANYITEMNKAFDNKKYDMYNGYVNIKNFGDSFISTYNSIFRFSDNTNQSRPRAHLGIGRRTLGTGVLIRNHLLVDGWKWFNLAEDAEFASCQIVRGYRLTFCEAAEFFDEQPRTFKILARQRMRWTKGRFFVFLRFFPRLLFAIIAPYDFGRKRRMKRYYDQQEKIDSERQGIVLLPAEIENSQKKDKPFVKFLSEIQKRFTSYDHMISVAPRFLLTFIYGFLYPAVSALVKVFTSGSYNIVPMLTVVFSYYSVFYLTVQLNNVITIIREHKHMRIKPLKLMLYLPFWPFVEILIDYVNIFAILLPIKWKTIPHVDKKQIDNIYEEKTISEYLQKKKPQD